MGTLELLNGLEALYACNAPDCTMVHGLGSATFRVTQRYSAHAWDPWPTHCTLIRRHSRIPQG
ncbi:hypothetical protein CBM2606_A10020 [Cupriavidus taiwanensis]|nr:hypothetical protein CBM2606_A10020 [Cupriavidus taiwanensis]